MAENNILDENLMVRYLLGDLTEEERLRVEERFFTDDEVSEQLLALENELLYDYAQGSLTQRQRELYERRFLSTAQNRRKAEYAAELMRAVADLRTTQQTPAATVETKAAPILEPLRAFFSLRSHTMRYALAAAGLSLAALSGWLVSETVRLRNQLDRLQAEHAAKENELRQLTVNAQSHNRQMNSELERERGQRAQLEQELARRQAQSGQPPAPSSILSLILTPGLIRDSGEQKRLLVPPGANLLQLQLELKGKENFRGWRAILRTAEGAEVWSRDLPRAARKALARAVTAQLPVRLLPEGDYELTLKGLTANGEFVDAGDYYFTLVRK